MPLPSSTAPITRISMPITAAVVGLQPDLQPIQRAAHLLGATR